MQSNHNGDNCLNPYMKSIPYMKKQICLRPYYFFISFKSLSCLISIYFYLKPKNLTQKYENHHHIKKLYRQKKSNFFFRLKEYTIVKFIRGQLKIVIKQLYFAKFEQFYTTKFEQTKNYFKKKQMKNSAIFKNH